MRGFMTMKTASATIKGFGVMRALRKSQAVVFHFTQDIRDETRMVGRAFGLGTGALADAVAILGESLEFEPI